MALLTGFGGFSKLGLASLSRDYSVLGVYIGVPLFMDATMFTCFWANTNPTSEARYKSVGSTWGRTFQYVDAFITLNP